MRDKHQEPLAVGDEVYCYIAGTPGSYGFVIGEMCYAKNGDVVCFGLEGKLGMPVNTCHLQRVGAGNPELVAKLRETYLAAMPAALKPN